jgi:Tol biopolymer transport system component
VVRPFRSLAFSKVSSAGGGAGGRREGPPKLRLLAFVAMACAVIPLTACGGDPPQIVDYSPQRGSIDVSTAVPIRISFDHDVDKASVEDRFRISPATYGSVHWLNGRELVYEHSTLLPSTSYEVILDAGYRDPSGNVYVLRHHWSFITERPPSLAGSTPAEADSGVDPSTYLTLDFTREMNPVSLRSAVSITPSVPFSVHLDPADSRRAIISPSELLAPNTAYQLSLGVSALDLDGNQLDRDQTIDFSTGAARPLHHWITFITTSADGTSTGLWIINESGIPRQLFNSQPVHSFSWSPDGTSLLVEVDGEAWWNVTPGAGSVLLGFTAPWAAALASGMGYVYIDDSGALHRQATDGTDDVIAGDVTQAAVAPSGLRVAYLLGASGPNEIWGYDVGLRARYQLSADSAPVSAVTWAPSGDRIAYLRSDLGTTSLRVKSLLGSGATTTIATGDIGAPAWFPDSTHIVFAATSPNPSSTVHKAYVVNVAAPPALLSAALGLPADPTVDLTSPVPSPDGHQIAFLNGDQVWLMNADGTRPTALTKSDPDSFPYSCRTLAWTSS